MFANASLIQKQSFFFLAVLNSVGLTLECLLVWIFFCYQNTCFTIPSTETTKGVIARLVSTASLSSTFVQQLVKLYLHVDYSFWIGLPEECTCLTL